MPIPELNERTRELVREMQQHFLVPFDQIQLLSTLEKIIPALDAPFQSPAQNFVHSLRAILSTITLPFALASASTEQQYHMRLQIAERIRAGNLDPEPGEPKVAVELRRDQLAAQRAVDRMGEFASSEEGINHLVAGVCHFLLDGIRRGAIEEPAAELILQGASLSWSALEVLSRDVFEAYVNSRPVLAQTLLNDPETKSRFGLTKIPIDMVAQFGFNLSNQMGTLLAHQQDFSDLRTIKAVFSKLFPHCQSLREGLQSRQLWILGQQRHLIIHRRGLIDAEFLRNTDSAQTMGSRLRIKPDELEQAIELVRDTGATMLEAIAS